MIDKRRPTGGGSWQPRSSAPPRQDPAALGEGRGAAGGGSVGSAPIAGALAPAGDSRRRAAAGGLERIAGARDSIRRGRLPDPRRASASEADVEGYRARRSFDCARFAGCAQDDNRARGDNLRTITFARGDGGVSRETQL